MNAPYGEIIRGDVCSRKMYMGGISYFSIGRFIRGLNVGANICPEAVERKRSEASAISEMADTFVFMGCLYVSLWARQSCDVLAAVRRLSHYEPVFCSLLFNSLKGLAAHRGVGRG